MTATKPRTIIITGANGFLGSELVLHFKQSGWRVIALVRNASKYSAPGVTYVDYDLAKPLNDSVFINADYVVHAAYVKHGREHPDALDINLQAAKRLLATSRRHKIKKNVFISSMAAHSGAESIYGKQKLALEKLFTGRDCVIVRPGLIVGNGGVVKQMTDFMKSKHAVPLIGGGTQPLQVVATYDLARTIKTILDKNKSGTFTIATPKVYSYKAFYDALRKHLKITVVFIPIPLWVLLAIVKLTALLRVPLSINEDNVLGLKNLRAAPTTDDLRALNIQLDDLEQILQKSTFRQT